MPPVRRRDSAARPADRPREACCRSATAATRGRPRCHVRPGLRRSRCPGDVARPVTAGRRSGIPIWSSMMRPNWPAGVRIGGPASPSPLACCCPSSGNGFARCPLRPRRRRARPRGRSTLDWPEGFPAVYLTMGTVFNGLGLLRSTVDAVASLGVDLLVTVGPRLTLPTWGTSRATYASNVMSRRPPCWVAVGSSSPMTARAPLRRPQPWPSPAVPPQGADNFSTPPPSPRGCRTLAASRAASGQAISTGIGRLLNDPGSGRARSSRRRRSRRCHPRRSGRRSRTAVVDRARSASLRPAWRALSAGEHQLR